MVISHEISNEVLFRVDSFKYYFNDTIICTIYFWKPERNKVKVYIDVYNYKNSCESSYKDEDNLAIVSSVNKLNQGSTDKIEILRNMNYLDDIKMINGIQGFRVENRYLQNIAVNDIYVYVTNEILMPDKYLFDLSYPIDFTPLELTRENEYQKWKFTIKSFTPKKLENPFEELKRDYKIK